MNKFYKPNFKKCNMNISSTIAEYLGSTNKNATLKVLEKELKKGYKNIVFICFDGLGINPLKINLDKKSFLRKHIVKTLVSTFPSTTTNATTSLLSNLLPLEHGWLGWSLHFDEINKNIDIYLSRDSKTYEIIDCKYPIDIPEYYFDNSKSDYEINTVFMPYVKVKNEDKNNVIKNEVELCNAVRKILQKDGKQFVYAYLDNPDSTMHDFGVSSEEAKRVITNINNEVEKLFDDCEDTLFIITADHGQVDIEGYIEFFKDQELNNLLLYPTFLDARTPAFKVKNGKEKEFEKKFKKRYRKDFKLFKTKDLIKMGYFGSRGDKGFLLGDYIAIGTNTNKLFIFYENQNYFKGHHTSLTKEMLVPLILASKK